jgi:hypothetical protein
LSTIVAAALREQVTVTENGRRKRITKLEAAIKQLMNRAASSEAGHPLAEADQNRAAKPDAPPPRNEGRGRDRGAPRDGRP